jgi:cob(I)alamin adenosyltransferase
MMDPFYTTTGDDGYTGLLKGERVPKEHPITEAVGAIDEANAALGVARAVCQDGHSKAILLVVQRDLYHLMAEVSASPENAARFRRIDPERVAWLEKQIESLSAQVQAPKDFIVPGDTHPAAALDLARTVVRRAERQVAGLAHTGVIANTAILGYLNRLSSLCFTLELFENQISGKSSPTLAREER